MLNTNRRPHGLAWHNDRNMTKQTHFPHVTVCHYVGKRWNVNLKKTDFQYSSAFLISCHSCGRSLLFWHILAIEIKVCWPGDLYVSLSLCFNVTPQCLSLPFDADTPQPLSFMPEKKRVTKERSETTKRKDKRGLKCQQPGEAGWALTWAHSTHKSMAAHPSTSSHGEATCYKWHLIIFYHYSDNEWYLIIAKEEWISCLNVGFQSYFKRFTQKKCHLPLRNYSHCMWSSSIFCPEIMAHT